ncbi:MAG: F0F1 ATP synthase subunit B [Bacteroidales bacterium]
MSLLLPESGLIIWMLISFSIVFFLLAKFGFPVITKKIEERKKYIDNSIELADQIEERMKSFHVKSEEIMKSAEKEHAKILKQAMSERAQILLEAKTDAKKVTQKELEEVKRAIQVEKEEAQNEIRRNVAILSVEVAEKIIRTNLDDEKEQMDMIDRMIDEVMVKDI